MKLRLVYLKFFDLNLKYDEKFVDVCMSYATWFEATLVRLKFISGLQNDDFDNNIIFF